MDKGAGNKERKLPENFCAVPFASLIFNPTGEVGCCREQGNKHVIGNIREQTVGEIWNSGKIRAWRREFLTGNIKTCRDHIRDRGCNRVQFNQELLQWIELSEFQTTPPKRISPDFNGKCNLECRMCTIWKGPNGLYDGTGFWELAEKELFPFVRQLDPLAGEPFVQKDFYRLIDIIARVNPGARWRITTNAHWKFTPYIRKELSKICLFGLNISLDSISGKQYAAIRKKGNLKTVLMTIDRLIAFRDERRKEGKGFQIVINTTIQRGNAAEITGFIDFALQKKCFPLIQFLYEPAKYSLLTLSRKKRIKILGHIFENMTLSKLAYVQRVIEPLFASLPGSISLPLRKKLFCGILARP